MTQVVLIKHSSVVVDAAVPSNEWQLNDQGRRLCRPLASALRMHELDVLVSSEERKAMETAENVARRLRIETHVALGLEEHHRPFIDSPAEFERMMGQFFSEPAQRVLGTESADEALARFGAAVDAVLAAESGRKVGVVTHGTVIALYAAGMLEIGPGALWERLSSPSFVVLDLTEGRAVRIVDEVE